MKTVQFLLATLLLTACSPQANSTDQPLYQTGTPVGWVGPRAKAYTFRTPEGAYCVYAQSSYERDSSLSCDFSKVN